MTTSCARTHLAAHSHQVFVGLVKVHLEVVGAAAAAVEIKIAVGNAETLVHAD